MNKLGDITNGLSYITKVLGGLILSLYGRTGCVNVLNSNIRTAVVGHCSGGRSNPSPFRLSDLYPPKTDKVFLIYKCNKVSS